MTRAPIDLPLSTHDREGVATLRTVLHELGYTPDAVGELLSEDGVFVREAGELPLYLRLLEPGPLATAIKLFLLGAPVEPEEAEAALAPLTVARLEASGVLRRDPDGVRATVNLAPTEELFLASDRPDDPMGAPDHVLGLSPPTRVLACLTVRRPVRRTLDLGTGFGVQALVAAAHSEHVVGTDINPRALLLADFNAALNGIENVEWRRGNMFEPVAAERFDLIVANPPYVISPETEYVYRDSGLTGDSFCEGLVRRLPDFLEEGGIAQSLIAWVHAEGEHWSAPVRRWVEGTGCDALLLHYVSHDALSYAAGWNRPLRGDDEAYAAALDRWLEYYRRLGIETIAWGAILLRRRTGDNWFWAHKPSVARVGPASHHVERLIAAQDLLSSLPAPEALLDVPLALADDHRLDQTLMLGGGEGEVHAALLRLAGGIKAEVALDAVTLQVLTQLDGSRPVGETLRSVGDDAFAEAALPAVRRLLELGFVVPAAT